ncbi:hypothetical protein DH2020_020625 [Rehmannia glutinosa]|uniref:BCCIP-like protein n=1 Tax=Rehmannia glutinosa TaxID=99300 RepID=A0ABR0WIR2_REHGL
MAMATLSKKVRRDIQETELSTKDVSHVKFECLYIVNGFLNNGKDGREQTDSSDNEEFEGVVQADFVFFDPKPSDFHGVKVLLQMYLDDKQWDISGFVDLILGQPTVGTVVKIENDEDDVDNKCIIELKDYLFKVCKDSDVIAKLRSLVTEHAQDVGLMVSQRVVNLPPQLLPPLYDALFDEVEWATEDEHKNADQNKETTKGGAETVIYAKPEDEIFLELKDYRLMGLVMAVEASKVSMFRIKMHSLIDE